MAKPLSWNTLKQAAVWLSDKTKEEWTEDRIIDFAIQQCRPDDIVEDIQYPTYLRAIKPITQEITIPSSKVVYIKGVPQIQPTDYSCVVSTKILKSIMKSLVDVDGETKETAKLFKSDLIRLRETGKSKLGFVFLNQETADTYTETFIKAENEMRTASDSNKRASLSRKRFQAQFKSALKAFPYIIYPGVSYPVDIGMAAVGIRDKELKKILRHYLEKKPLKAKTVKKLRPDQQDKLDCQAIAKEIWTKNPQFTKVEVINSSVLAPYKNKYTGKNTLSNWLKEIDPRPVEDRRGRPCKNTRQ